jgi:hypothetical protein
MESSPQLRVKYISPEEYRIRSWAVNSDAPVRIELSFGQINQDHELTATANLIGEKGRVQVKVRSERFLEDAATVRKFVLDKAAALMGGSEPYSTFRTGGRFYFHFSCEPEKSIEALLNGFVEPENRGWNNSGRGFLFYPEKRAGAVRELEIFDAWVINRVAELELASQVIDPAGIAHQAGATEKRIITQIGRINELRRNWGMSPLPRHPSFAEIDTAVKLLRRELHRWPALADVAPKLAVEPSALKTALDSYNQKRISANQTPLLLP